MVDEERRAARRAQLAGVRVTYESAAGDRVDADATDLARGGLFVRTATPLPVGKRIALEIQVVGEQAPWSALGRVVWIRERGEGDEQPPGMGVKLIDVDDAVAAGLDRLVETREPTEPGVGEPAQAPLPAVPLTRERTIQGLGGGRAQAIALAREKSIPIDLVARRPESSPAADGDASASAGSGQVDKWHAAGRWVVFAVLLAVAAVAGYVLVDGIARAPERQATIPPVPAATSAPPAGSAAPLPATAQPDPALGTPTPNASAAASASAGKKPSQLPTTAPSSVRPGPAPSK
jgi:uncharacterized protein (TIGR02266 family)